MQIEIELFDEVEPKIEPLLRSASVVVSGPVGVINYRFNFTTKNVAYNWKELTSTQRSEALVKWLARKGEMAYVYQIKCRERDGQTFNTTLEE